MSSNKPFTEIAFFAIAGVAVSFAVYTFWKDKKRNEQVNQMLAKLEREMQDKGKKTGKYRIVTEVSEEESEYDAEEEQ